MFLVLQEVRKELFVGFVLFVSAVSPSWMIESEDIWGDDAKPCPVIRA